MYSIACTWESKEEMKVHKCSSTWGKQLWSEASLSGLQQNDMNVVSDVDGTMKLSSALISTIRGIYVMFPFFAHL